MDEAIFAERTFTLDDRPLVVRACAPARAPGGAFQCRWSSAWPEGEARGRACGENGVQALMLALRRGGMALVETEAYRSGRLLLWGQADLYLPPAWGAGPLYDIPTRSDGG